MENFGGPKYIPVSAYEEDVVSKMNSFLSQFGLPAEVTNIRDITSSLFVVLFESLFCDQLPGIVRHPVTRNDEISNCQMVIDTLSADIIQDNLSHIRGVDIVDGRMASVSNLLDIFLFLYEYVIKETGSDLSTSTDIDGDALDRQDEVRSLSKQDDDGVLDMVPESVRGMPEKSNSGKQTDQQNWQQTGCESADCICAAYPKTVMNGKHGGAPEELVQEQQRAEKHSDDKARPVALDEKCREIQPAQFDPICLKPLSAAVLSTVNEDIVPDPDVDSVNGRSSLTTADSQDAFTEITQHTPTTSGSKASRSTTVAASPCVTYPVLQHGWANHLQSIPDRLHTTDGSIPYHSRQTPEKPYCRRHKQLPRSEILTRARRLTLDGPEQVSGHPLSSGDVCNVDKAKLEDQLQGHVQVQNFLVGMCDKPHSTESQGQVMLNEIQGIPRYKSKAHHTLRSHDDICMACEHDRVRKQVKERCPGVNSVTSTSSEPNETNKRDRIQGEGKKPSAKHLTRLQKMRIPELASEQQHLKKEEEIHKHKQDFVRKLYEEEFENVVEQVKSLIDHDQKLMADMEKEYSNLMLMVSGTTSKKLRLPRKAKGYILPTIKKCKSRHHHRDKDRKYVQKPHKPSCLGENEDWMHAILEGLPQLSVSDRTLNNVLQKSVRQIKSLTSNYEESKQRKSREAQFQMEEAARKHEALAARIKKQLDHNHRLQRVKEQKKQKIAAKNRIREQRSQEARLRRCYSDCQTQTRAKTLKQQSRDEMVFRKLHKDGLAIQKEKILDVHRYVREQQEKQAQRRQEELDALEIYYRDQFEILVSRLLKDKEDLRIREKAHEKMLEQTKRELRHKVEKELKNLLSELIQDDDDDSN